MKTNVSSTTNGILKLDRTILKLENTLSAYIENNRSNLNQKKLEWQETLIKDLKSSSNNLQFGYPDQAFLEAAFFRLIKNAIENRDGSITGLTIICQLNKGGDNPFAYKIFYTK